MDRLCVRVSRHGLSIGDSNQDGGRRYVRLAIEADVYRYHSGMIAWQRDLERRNSLTSQGWRVIHVTWNDVVSGSERILAELRQALGVPGQLTWSI